MANISSQLLFLTTSPRTPEKMIAEIGLLIDNFNGKVWDTDTQTAFMSVLSEADFYHGEGLNDPAFSARDRINRAPKSLGFVTLSPTIQLTPAGEQLLTAERKDEVFLRQMLKFQLPSPYHIPTVKAASFCVVLRGKEAELACYSLCKFQNGKVYNSDLSASYNIGSRYYIREILKSLPARERLELEAKVPQVTKRSTCTLSTLINLNAELGSLVA